MISHAMKIQFLRRWGENEGNSNCCCKISNEFCRAPRICVRDVIKKLPKPKEHCGKKNNRIWDSNI